MVKCSSASICKQKPLRLIPKVFGSELGCITKKNVEHSERVQKEPRSVSNALLKARKTIWNP